MRNLVSLSLAGLIQTAKASPAIAAEITGFKRTYLYIRQIKHKFDITNYEMKLNQTNI